MNGGALTSVASARVPLVSVITTTYNGSAYLRETIDSILRQTCRDFEYIIIDDCSTDDTVPVIKSYDDPRIVFVQNEENSGISESRNRGLHMARGAFIATTDQDDISEAERLERQVRFLRANPDISAVASRVDLLSNGTRGSDPMVAQAHPLLIHFALYFALHNTTYSSLCLRKQFVVDHDLYFRPRYHYAEDFDLFCRIAECGRFAILQESLVVYRLHAGNNSKVHYEEMAANGMMIIKEFYARALGRPIDQAEGLRIWHGLIVKRGSQSVDALRELGRLMTEVTTKFTARHAESEEQQQWISVLAAQIWHDIVDRSVSVLGLGAERVRGEFEALLAWSPSRKARLRTKAIGALASLRGRRHPTA